MWLSRIVAAVIAASLLAGCGFQPLYGGGKSGPAASELASIKIEPIADRSGQLLRNHLLDLLTPYGRPDRPKYALRVTMTESGSGLAVKKSEFATRANLQVSATYQLLDGATRQPLFSGTTTITGGYNILSSEFSTLASEQDVRERVIEQVASEMQNRLSAYFRLRQEQQGAGRAP